MVIRFCSLVRLLEASLTLQMCPSQGQYKHLFPVIKGKCRIEFLSRRLSRCHTHAQQSRSSPHKSLAVTGVSFVITSFLSQPRHSLLLSPSPPHQPPSAPAASFTSFTVPSCALLEAATPRPDFQHCAPYAKQRRVRPSAGRPSIFT